MSFEIIIKEKRKYTGVDKTTWGVIGTKEVAREEQFYSRTDTEPRTRIEEVRGYLPPVERTYVEDIEVLKQTVDTLDLPAVIKAINKI